MVKLFFSLVFVLTLLGRLLPVVNTLVQTIYMQYLSSFAGLHTVTLLGRIKLMVRFNKNLNER